MHLTYYVLRAPRTEVATLAESLAGRLAEVAAVFPIGWAPGEHATSSLMPPEVIDLFAGAGGITLGVVWFVVQVTRGLVSLAVDYWSRRQLLKTIERLADVSPPARVELTWDGFVYEPRPPDPTLRPPEVVVENVPGMIAGAKATQDPGRGHPPRPRRGERPRLRRRGRAPAPGHGPAVAAARRLIPRRSAAASRALRGSLDRLAAALDPTAGAAGGDHMPPRVGDGMPPGRD